MFDLSDRTQQVAGLSGDGGFVELGSHGDLTVVQTQNAVFGGGLRGDGVFTKAGAGALNLTGTSSFTGLVNVNAGRLALNGVLPGQISVNSGGVLGGAGAAGRIVVHSGGMLAPGNSIGVLRVNTGVVFEAGSIYSVEVNAAGESDRLDAAGQALLQGGTVQVLAENGNYRPQTSYVILSALGGVQGQFANVTSNFAYLSPRLIYSANEVKLSLTRNDVELADVAQTRNQRATASAVADAFTNTSDVYFNLVGLSADGARQAFDSLSGEAHPSSLSAAVQHGDSLRRNLVERLDISAPQGLVMWAEGIGERTELDAGAGTAGVQGRNADGFRMGLETQVGSARIGVAAGYGDARLDVRDRSSRTDLEMIHIAAYAGASAGPVHLRGGMTYSDLDFSTRRTARIGALSQELTADYGGRSWQAFGEAGYGVAIDGAVVEPFVGFNGLWLGNDAFQEVGGDMALTGAEQTRERFWSIVGVKTRHHFEIGAPVTLNAKAGWQHALGERTVESDLAFADGEAFTIHGAPLAKDAALVDVRLEWRLSERMALGVGYNGTFADQGQAQAARVMFSSQF
ncbi:Extracellular serine protease precursor [compost metagenome]